MFKRVFSLFLCAVLLCQGCLAFAEADPAAQPQGAPETLAARYALLYEESTDTVLYSKLPDRTNPGASMTKVMTALLVLEYDPDLSGTTVVPPEAVSEQYCYWMDTMHLAAGQEVSVRDLMNYLLIPSGNEAATTLAAYVAGDIDTFIDMMNAKAAELGMTHTHYADPHGLSSQDLVTCEDMLILCREAMKNPLFREIVGTTSGVMPVSNFPGRPIRYSTTNRVMDPRSNPFYETDFTQYIVGIKTGSTPAAGLNLSCCMEYDGLSFYSVVMNSQELPQGEGHFLDTIDLMTYARSFHKEGFNAGDPVARAKTLGSFSENLELAAESDIWVLVQDAAKVTASLDDIGLQVKAGDVLGTVTLEDAFGNAKTVSLVAVADASTALVPYIAIAAAVVVLAVAAVLLVRKKKRAKA